MFFGIILILVLVTLYSGLRILESTVLFGEQSSGNASKTITRNGVDYFPRQDITTVLLMTADMGALVVFDETEETSNMLFLPRDVLVTAPEGQWEKIRNEISAYLYHLDIDCFAALDREAVVILNDVVGGVTVSQGDSSEEVLLMGEQAVDYLDGAELEQQMAYWTCLGESFREMVKQDTASLLGVFEQVKPHVVTDCSLVSGLGLLARIKDFELRETLTPAGEYVVSGENMEFHADEEMLDQLILELFYAPKK